MLSVYYGPAAVYVLVPERAGSLLGRMTDWIMANSRMLEIVVGLGFGVYFLGKGLVVLRQPFRERVPGNRCGKRGTS
jgi:hypothetical protein